MEAVKKPGIDVAVFMTNSSFSSAAKKAGEAAGIELWDRNYIDRMAIGVDVELEKPVIKKSSSNKTCFDCSSCNCACSGTFSVFCHSDADITLEL